MNNTKLYFVDMDMSYFVKDFDGNITESGTYTNDIINKIIKRIREKSQRYVSVYMIKFKLS